MTRSLSLKTMLPDTFQVKHLLSNAFLLALLLPFAAFAQSRADPGIQ